MSEEQKKIDSIKINTEFHVTIPNVNGNESEAFNQNISAFYPSIVATANDFIPFNRNSVETIVIADEDRLGEIIFEIQDKYGIEKGYTGQREGHYVTAAKTISYLSNEGEIKTSIIILSNLIYEIMGAVSQNIPLNEWNVDARFCFYALVHELGHGYDNLLRKNVDKKRPGSEDLEKETDWEILAKYYSDILISEYLASFYAGKSVNPELQNQMIDNWFKDSNALIDDLLARKNSFHSTAVQAASHSLWVILTQYAKLVGHKLSNTEEDLSIPYSYYDWESEINEIFVSFEEILRTEFTPINSVNDETHKTQNPEFDLDKLAFEKLFPIWEKLANENGFFFDEEDD
jgi:hypothetical protein